MKRFAMLIGLSLIGCGSTDDGDYPVQPGGAFAPTGTGSGSSAQIAGRACLIEDPRDLATCSTVDAGGFTVTAGGAATTTAMDGSFVFPSSVDGSMVGITGADIVPTQAAARTAMSVPLLRADLFSQMLAANGITPTAGSGSILATVTRAGEPVSGVTATSTPAPSAGPLFDGDSPTAWRLDATGARGVVWLPGVAIGPTSLTFRDVATSGETTVDGVQVVNGGITILDAVLP